MAADSESVSQKAEEFIRAARNYEIAATARSETGEALLSVARELRKKDYDDEKTRLANMKKAGNYERQAGNLLFIACQSYDKAAAAWSKASTSYKRAGSPTKADQTSGLAGTARDKGTEVCERAAQAFEYSAEAYSEIDAGQMAFSSERAAAMREALALRIK